MTISCEGGYIVYKCKNCVFCTWACPNWMCMNKEHPDFDVNYFVWETMTIKGF